MLHDDACEMRTPTHPCRTCGGGRAWTSGPHCHCGSRAFPLCEPCKRAQHTDHHPVTGDGPRCACDLCQEAA